MDLGVIFPTAEVGTDPGAIRALADAVEDLGYRRLVIYDHVLGAVHADREPSLWGPYDELTPFHEPLTLLSFLAGTTERIELATGVLILPQRQTALVAKQVVELDMLSRGRFVLGVGTGWNYVEYEALGVPWERRAARFDEQLSVLQQLWSDRVVDFQGAFHRIDRAGICPLPDRHIPLWFGGHTDAAFARAVRCGDGFTLRTAGDERRRSVDRLHNLLEASGRDLGSFELEATVEYAAGPESWRRDVAELEAMGVAVTTVRTMSTGASWRGTAAAGLRNADDHIAAIQRFKAEMGGV